MKKYYSKHNKNDIVTGFSINTKLEDVEETPIAEKKSFTRGVIEWLEVLTAAIIAVVVIFTVIFRVATIDGDSMKNTLYENERIIISNLNYTPKQRDIVVISRNIENSVDNQTPYNTPIIKRVIAVGGQTVNIDFNTGIVFVDGKPLLEPYISSKTNKHDVEFPLYVPEGYIFVLGDNRSESLDSRFSSIGEGGLIDTRYVLGRAVFRIFPFEKAERLDNK